MHTAKAHRAMVSSIDLHVKIVAGLGSFSAPMLASRVSYTFVSQAT